jgi:cell division inhibitor SepF
MGALRRAGVWLGLIEDELDRDSFYDDEFVDDEDFAVPARTRTVVHPTQRRGDRERPVADRPVSVRADEPGERFERDLRIVRDRESRDRDLRDRDARDRDARDRDARDRDARDPRDRDVRDRDRELRDRDRTARDLRVDRRSDADDVPERPTVTRQRDEPPPVRPLSRPTAGSTALSVPAEESLTLAPPVQLRERAAVSDDRLARRYEITTLHPTSYSEARAIGEQFRDGHPVIMNLTDLAEADAKRLVDFAAGLAFGLRGSIERVTNRVFLLTPPNIRVSEEEKQRIAEPGFFDQR